MGDMSAEPSMEEILSSIKRIIAEEGEGTQARARRARAAPQPIEPEPEEVLELSDPMPHSRMEPARVEQPAARRDAVAGEGLGQARLALGLGHGEAGVLHAQRLQQPRRQEYTQRLAGSHLDHAAEHVGAVAVVPGAARLVGQRQLGDALGELRVQRVAARRPRFRALRALRIRCVRRRPPRDLRHVLKVHLPPRLPPPDP
jgi:hypothetical protein